MRFDEGDAEALPYDDASFDIVVSLIGAMFAPQPERVAADWCVCVVPLVVSSWRTGLPTGTLDRCSRLSVSMFLHHPSWSPRSNGVKMPRYVSDFVTGAAQVDTMKRTYAMRYPFPPAEVVDSSASTTGRRIVPLPHLMPRVAAPSAMIWKNSGKRIMWHRTA